jgi:succinate dehydrogenase (ubiquinone) membrane anchor subunit
LGIVLPLHCHLGIGQVVTDYLNKRKIGAVGNKAVVAALYACTALTIYGLFQFNTNDVGITEFVSKCWSAKKEETAKK